MRLTLTYDDGEVLSTWSLPNALGAAQVEEILSDGLHRHHHLDRCDRCGGFFEKTSMVAVADADSPTVTFQPCADLPY